MTHTWHAVIIQCYCRIKWWAFSSFFSRTPTAVSLSSPALLPLWPTGVLNSLWHLVSTSGHLLRLFIAPRSGDAGNSQRDKGQKHLHSQVCSRSCCCGSQGHCTRTERHQTTKNNGTQSSWQKLVNKAHGVGMEAPWASPALASGKIPQKKWKTHTLVALAHSNKSYWTPDTRIQEHEAPGIPHRIKSI